MRLRRQIAPSVHLPQTHPKQTFSFVNQGLFRHNFKHHSTAGKWLAYRTHWFFVPGIGDYPISTSFTNIMQHGEWSTSKKKQSTFNQSLAITIDQHIFHTHPLKSIFFWNPLLWKNMFHTLTRTPWTCSAELRRHWRGENWLIVEHLLFKECFFSFFPGLTWVWVNCN